MCVLLTLTYLARFSVNVPFWDEWVMVPYYLGAVPVTLQWLWSPHNEHRLPLPRLAMVTLYPLFGGDLRGIMLVNYLHLAAWVAALLAVLRRVRGRWSAPDALLPLILLTLANFENLLWAFQTAFYASACLVLGLLAVSLHLLQVGRWTGCATAVGAAATLCLPLCGSNGVVFAAPASAWLIASGLLVGRGDAARRAQLIAAGLGGLVLTAAYFVGLPGGGAGHALSRKAASAAAATLLLGVGPGVWQAGASVTRFGAFVFLALVVAWLALRKGGAGAEAGRVWSHWPTSSRAGAAFALGLGVLSSLALAAHWTGGLMAVSLVAQLTPVVALLAVGARFALRQALMVGEGGPPGDIALRVRRSAALGFAALLLGGVLLVAGIGLSRAEFGAAPRYHVLIAPVLAVAYVAVSLFADRLTRRLTVGALAALLLLTFPFNLQAALVYGRKQFAVRTSFLDAAPRATISGLAEAGAGGVFPEAGPLKNPISLLRRAGVRPYTAVRPDRSRDEGGGTQAPSH